jgi:hypothetical protein
MGRDRGETSSELLVKAAAAALLLGSVLFLVKVTQNGRSAAEEAVCDLLYFLGLLGVVLFSGFAFAASRRPK